ncbi:MAG: hypothetical protein A3F35_00760 [Candidatus Woykebacteria bacterium RIFCSPHIGHO2_12_FULL_45_10]|uniref:Uncharacterized protein n=1 Tax=Candidatus Woykebacteria bacterium RIFCSPHIGHO2_12_FULL_45_10 TaxID=1802603 RepID=A0A1G1WRQ1_9BACT|nr:MAG: hypothetical protein A3F35_00760 [Candidatus Woykebacteria bacterium RIFCSPHIGHO2_12_FULL_45_10]
MAKGSLTDGMVVLFILVLATPFYLLDKETLRGRTELSIAATFGSFNALLFLIGGVAAFSVGHGAVALGLLAVVVLDLVLVCAASFRQLVS